MLEYCRLARGIPPPSGVIKRLNDHIRSFGLQKSDEVWLVLDVDKWNHDQLLAVYNECKRKNYCLAASNPCFELWLVLHQVTPIKPCTPHECEKELVKLLGAYSKSFYDIDKLVPHIELAVKHAQNMHERDTDYWPKCTGTHVYRLVEKLVG